MKFVLALESEKTIKNLAEGKYQIEQGYLIVSKGLSLRFRKSVNSKTTYIMTFKTNVSGRVIEIEKKIDERDFEDIWPQCLNKLEKTRYLVRDKGRHLWEIDYFRDHNSETYFAMAEFEMPEGKTKPDFMPKFVHDNLIYEVLLTDCRFSSKLIADVRYAKNLYRSLTNASTSTCKPRS